MRSHTNELSVLTLSRLGTNAAEAVDNLEVLAIFSRLLETFLQSPRVVQTICQALFHVITLHGTASRRR